ncbi:MAG: nicotinate-nucleotide adenylyltransferase [Oscillatoria sp. SIO1A7]|nr:nicotinate-nucleotide adenylyltransferase [Oscillatoria sp. SIO1A7]
MIQIALFGTSADPPTTGHQAIISWLCENFDWVAVWAADNPLKAGQQTALEHRAAMLRLVIEEIAATKDNLGFYSELSNPRTLETVRRARDIWPDASFSLAIGYDLVRQIPHWYKAEELLPQVRLVVVPRPGYSIAPADLERLEDLGTSVAIAPLEPPRVSSSAYRQHRGNIAIGELQPLPPAVRSYIYREQLYLCQEAK